MALNKAVKKIFLPVGLIAILLFVGIVAASIFEGKRELTIGPDTSRAPNMITVGEASFSIELATTYETRSRGLSGREALPEDAGMLFLFNQPGSYSFWMKDMNFPLDIIWIAERQVAGFQESVQPEGDSPKNTYFPPVPVTEVLEINAGLVEKLGIKVGDVVELVYTK